MNLLLQTITAIDEFTAARPDAAALARVASFAALIDPPLLRTLRLKLLPHAGVDAEADLWHSPFVDSRTADGIVLRPEIAAALREGLAQSDPKLYEKAWELTEKAHQWLPATLRCEELINSLQFAPQGDGRKQSRDVLRAAVRSIVETKNVDVARWAASALHRLPPDLRRSEEGRLLIAAARFAVSDAIAAPSLPENLTPEQVAWVSQGAKEPEVIPFAVKVRPGVLEIGPRAKTAEESPALVLVPKLAPLWVEVAAEPGKPRVFVMSHVEASDDNITREVHFHLNRLLVSAGYATGAQGEGWTRGHVPSETEGIVVVARDDERFARASVEWLQNSLSSIDVSRKVLLCVSISNDVMHEDSPLRRVLRDKSPQAMYTMVRNPEHAERIADDAMSHVREVLPPGDPSAWQRLNLDPARTARVHVPPGPIRVRTRTGAQYTISAPTSLWRNEIPELEQHRRQLHNHEFETALSAIVERGQMVVISGPEGSGRSTLARRIAYELMPRYREHRSIQLLDVSGPAALQQIDQVDDFLAPSRLAPEWVDRPHPNQPEAGGTLTLIENLDEPAVSLLRQPTRPHAIIVTSRRPFYESGATNISLAPLTQEEAADILLDHVQPGVSVHELATIVPWYPGPLLQIAQLLGEMSHDEIERFPLYLATALELAVLTDPIDPDAIAAVIEAINLASSTQESNDADPGGLAE